LNGYRLSEDFRESQVRSAENAYSRIWIYSLRKSSTLEKTRTLDFDIRKCQEVEYSRRRTRTLDLGSARKSSILDSDRERSIADFW